MHASHSKFFPEGIRGGPFDTGGGAMVFNLLKNSAICLFLHLYMYIINKIV